MNLAGMVPMHPIVGDWIASGCAVQSSLIVYAFASGTGPLGRIPLCVLLGILNLSYAIASTSWLLYRCFAVLSYLSIPLVCLVVSPTAASLARGFMRMILRRLSFTDSRVAYFYPPALRIDTEVEGLFVVRGLTFTLSSMRIEAHGIEVAVQLAERMQLALYVDEITIDLARNIYIGDIYGTIKDEDSKTIFRDLTSGGGDDASDIKSPSLDRPPSRNDSDAEKQYDEIREGILATSPLQQSHKKVKQAQDGTDSQLTAAQTRAVMCGKLVGSPAVPHAPESSIRVTTLQNLLPRGMAHFLARLPFLLRLLLLPLNFLHPITISSITVAGPGSWLRDIMQERILDHYLKDSEDGKDLQNRVREWLEQAMFTLDFTRIWALGQVPLRTMHDIVAQLRCTDATVFRTTSDTAESLVEFGGADMEFVMPSFLLPHHEHLVPARPSAGSSAEKDEIQEMSPEDQSTDKDEAHISMRIHATLPAATDHDLLEFVVDLVNASKVLEMAAGTDDDGDGDEGAENESSADAAADEGHEKRGLRDRAKGMIRNHVKARGKQLAMRGLGNDQSEWAKSLVRSAAEQCERMHGDVGYSGFIPVALEPYRAPPNLYTKLWA